jgi:N2-acetyl-L-2,4-diaminobutanoate deacetylase
MGARSGAVNAADFEPGMFAAGQNHALDLEFTAMGNSLALPVLLARGAQRGKTLVATAGVHGDEYEGVRAIFDVFRGLDPAQMSGDFLAIPVANPPAFWNLSRTSPLDDGNLARMFPGRRDGSPTECIAWHIDHRILPHADLYLDLHSAGVKCLMPSMIGFHSSDTRARAAAAVFGARVVWEHPTVAPGRTVSSAIARGIPALYTEAFGAGRIAPDDLKLFTRGIRNLLQHLHILPGEPEIVLCEIHLAGDGNVDQSVSSARRGFLVPKVELLEFVTQGQEIGVLLDLHGEVIERFTAPSGGVVALIHACPKVDPGEPLFLITGVAA